MSLSEFFQQISTMLGSFADKNSVSGALVVALITFIVRAIIAINEEIVKIARGRLEKRAAYVRFFTFVKIRQRNCKRIFSAERRIATIDRLKAGIRMYVVSGPETDDYDVIVKYEKYMSYDLQLYIRLLTEYDNMLFAQYAKIGTDDFKDLNVPRKTAAVENLFDAADDVIKISEKVIGEFRKLAHLSKLEPEINKRVDALEA